ncbi:MAG: hypothetical protein ACLFSE_08460 [Spirochaetia bacterium]
MIRRKRKGSDIIYYTFSEFAFLLLFLSLGAGAAVTVSYLDAKQIIEDKTREIEVLNELLADKRYGVVPCWKRPEGAVPEITGTVTIHGGTLLTVLHHAGKSSQVTFQPGNLKEKLIATVSGMFREEQAFAEKKSCYLRFTVINETNSYELYHAVSRCLSDIGMVIVDE